MKKLFTTGFSDINNSSEKAVLINTPMFMKKGWRLLLAGSVLMLGTLFSNVYAQCPNIISPARDTTVECDGSGNTAALTNWLLTNGGAVESGVCGVVTWNNDFVGMSDLCGATGAVTVTFTVTDGVTTDNSTATFTIVDTTPPGLTCPPDEPLNNDFGFCRAFTQEFTPLVSDACDAGVIIPTTTTNFNNPFPIGSTTVVWSATDACNNSGTCSYVVTVSDIEEPHVASPNDFVLTIASVGTSLIDEVTWSLVDNVTSAIVASGGGYAANSSNTIVINPSTPGSYTFNISTEAGGFDDNVASYTLTCNGNVVASGIVGNASGPSQTIADGPLAACNDIDTAFVADSAFCSYTNSGTSLDPSVFENCTLDTLFYTLTGATSGSGANTLNGTAFNVGITTVTWTAIDSSSNSSTSSFNVTVTETAAPILVTAATDSTVECDGAGNTTALNDWLNNHGGAVAFDPCGPVVWTHNFTSLSNLCGATGAATVTFTATGADLLFVQTTATFTVNDTTPPTLTCPPDDVADNDMGFCSAIRPEFAPFVTDACDAGVITPTTTSNFNIPFPVGTTPVVWTATDACGNSNTCTYNIIVNDSEAPHVASPNDFILTISAVGNTFMDEVTWSLVDNGTLATVASGGGYGGNSSNTEVINLNSAGPFTFNISTDLLGGTGDNVANWTITCNGATVSSGTVGNPTGPSQTLAISPIAACNSIDTLLYTDSAFCTYTNIGTNLDPMVVENCALNSVSYSLSGATSGSGLTTLNGAAFGVGITTIVWTAEDDTGNVASSSFNILVVDTAAPIMVTQAADSTVECDGAGNIADLTSWLNNHGGAVAFDPCGPVTWTHNFTALSDSCGATGSSLVIFTAMGPDSLTTQTSATFTIIDTAPPVLTCPPNDSTFNDQGFCSAYRPPFVPTITDACDLDTIIPSTTTDFNIPFPVGTTPVVWSAVDACGNTGTCTYNVVVIDNEAPHVAAPNDFILTVAAVGNTFMDEVTWSLVDEGTLATVASGGGYGGNSSNVSVIDLTSTGPFTFNISTDLLGGTGDNVATWTLTCNGTTVSSGTVGNPAGPPQTLQFTGIAACNSVDTNLITDPLVCSYTNNDPLLDATVIENCTSPVAPTSTYSANNGAVPATGTTLVGTVFQPGITTIVWTAVDQYGNADSATYQIIVIDSVPPIVTCPADVNVFNDPGVCNAVVPDVNLAATIFDNCSILSLTYTATGANTFSSPLTGINQVPTTTFNVGTTVITYIITDGSFNTDTCSFNVTVTDNELPLITCPTDSTISALTGSCEQTFVFTIPVPTDNCGIDTLMVSTNDPTINIIPTGVTAFGLFPVGVTTITYTVVDIHGNSNTCSFDLTVVDDQDPIITTCPSNITVGNDAGVCGAVVNWVAPTASDNCPGVTMTSSHVPGSIFPIGVDTVYYIATDASNNVDTCSFIVTVNDTESPVIVCPANIVTGNDAGLCSAIVTFNPTFTDNCPGGTITQTAGLPSGSAFPVGSVTTNTFEATDSVGNIATCSFTVTVNDTELPTITCPANIAMNNGTDTCGATVNYTMPVGADNCPGETVTMLSGLASGSVFPVGVTTNVYQVVDASGNSSTCSFTVTITDAQLPVITCDADVNVNNDPGLCSANVILNVPVTTDNCLIASVTNDHPSTTYPVGTTPVTWTVVDVNGNSSTCIQNVTVTDNETPIVSCPTNISTSAAFGLCEQTITTVDPTFSDNCSVTSLTWTLTGATVLSSPLTGINTVGTQVFNVGVTTVTYIVNDASLNADTCSFTVTVIDNQVPTITCPANITVSNDASLCSAVVNYVAPVGTDNCPGYRSCTYRISS